MNRFTDRYKMGGVRMRILVVESFVLKKKRECEIEEEEGAHVRGIEGRTPASLAPCNPLW
jgi:hypothetical protein